MIVEHTIKIDADMEIVWDIFTDLTCWADWNRVINNVTSENERLTEGKSIRFCLRPFGLPVYIEPIVNELISMQKVVWSGKKHGIRARHEFLFSREENAVLLTSREEFKVNPFSRIYFHIAMKKLHQMSIEMLQQLKEASESTGDTQ